MTPSVNGSLMVQGAVYADGAKVATESAVDEKIVERCNCAGAGKLVIGNINIRGQAGMDAVAGFQNVVVAGDLYFYSSPTPLTDLTGLASVTSIGGSVSISQINALTNLTGLDSVTSIGGSLFFITNDALTRLAGLDSLTSIGGDLYISSQAVLTDLNGLASVTSIGGSLKVQSNSALTDLTGLASVTSIGGDLQLIQPLAHICASTLNRLKGLAASLLTIDVIEDPC